MSFSITGQDLIAAGLKPGKWFKDAIAAANAAMAEGQTREEALNLASGMAPPSALALLGMGERQFYRNIEAETDEEIANVAAVEASMQDLMRTPVVKAGAIMPDACPAGPVGTIPVGGVVASEAIHPGMHSADICCSMAISTFPGLSPAAVLDAIHEVTHFGPGERPRGQQIRPDDALLARFAGNALLSDISSRAIGHFATQGDGNHFAFVGTLASTGETALVTHHGSRSPGAKLYGKGMKIAERFRNQLSPDTLKQNAWIPADSPEGEAYWEALQVIRDWTKASHFTLHDLAAEKLSSKVGDRFWNEHNFVFRKTDGLFYHGKGATPAFDGWAADASGLTLIPLNMGSSILIARGLDAEHGLGFAPHGAGRNFSRTQHKRNLGDRPVAEVFAEETKDIDARFFCGIPDVSELPSAYKDAVTVRRQIERFGLAEIVDEVLPYGSIMAGDWEKDAPWRKKR